MDVPAHEPEGSNAKSSFTVLVTGANSGLGFAICCRLIDEFLQTRPQTQTIHILFSTRDAKKGADTLVRLNAHLQKTLREANGKTMGISLLLEGRVKMEGVLVELTSLLSVKALAKQLLRRGQRLDAVVWNAGIGGWTGTNWPLATWQILTNFLHNTTYPRYQRSQVGALTKRQIAAQVGKQEEDEAEMGQVFTANVFGHYMLTHWLGPLMHPESRIIWISSVSAVPEHFTFDDFQKIRGPDAYEASKRLTDFLVLTSELPSTEPYVDALLPISKPRPTMYVTHPGILATNIGGVPWILEIFMIGAFYLARILGGPWHTVAPYKAAVSAVFCCLAPHEQLDEREEREGKGKWGSAVSFAGDEHVMRTEVEGWGYCGRVGVVPGGSITTSKARYSGLKETNKELREQFEDDGRRCWREMEALRVEWEQRLGSVNIADSEDL